MALEEQWVLLSLGLAIIGVRTYERCKQVGGPKGWDFDDYMILVVAIIFTLETVAAFEVGNLCDGLTNSYMTEQQRAAIETGSDEFEKRVLGSKIQIFGWSCYAAILWGLKFCLASYYSRLTARLTHFRTRIIVAYVLLATTYLATALTLLLSCQPFDKFWQISPDPGNLCQPTRSRAYVFMCLFPNIFTDIYLSTIPLPLVWSANIGLKRKLALLPLFGGAIFVMMACTIRAVVILTAGEEGASTGSQWACRETFVAIVVTNLLVIYPLLRQAAKRIGLSMLFSTRGTRGGSKGYPLDSAGQPKHNTTGGGGGGGGSKWRSNGGGGGGGGSYALNTITRVTGAARESDEHIILETKGSPPAAAGSDHGSGDRGAGGGGGGGGGMNNIVVSREFTVETETSSTSDRQVSPWDMDSKGSHLHHHGQGF